MVLLWHYWHHDGTIWIIFIHCHMWQDTPHILWSGYRCLHGNNLLLPMSPGILINELRYLYVMTVWGRLVPPYKGPFKVLSHSPKRFHKWLYWGCLSPSFKKGYFWMWHTFCWCNWHSHLCTHLYSHLHKYLKINNHLHLEIHYLAISIWWKTFWVLAFEVSCKCVMEQFLIFFCAFWNYCFVILISFFHFNYLKIFIITPCAIMYCCYFFFVLVCSNFSWFFAWFLLSEVPL